MEDVCLRESYFPFKDIVYSKMCIQKLILRDSSCYSHAFSSSSSDPLLVADVKATSGRIRVTSSFSSSIIIISRSKGRVFIPVILSSCLDYFSSVSFLFRRCPLRDFIHKNMSSQVINNQHQIIIFQSKL